MLPDGTDVTGTTDGDGNVVIPVDLPVGDSNITVTYPGDETYNSTQITVPITVNPRDSVTDAEVVNNTVGNVTLEVEVNDAVTGETVPDGPVEVYIDDVLVGTGEIVDGNVKLTLDIDEAGTYDITIKYEGNTNYTTSEIVLDDITIVPHNATIEADEVENTVNHTQVNITLTDPATQEAIAGAPIEVYYNGTLIANATTGSDGSVLVDVNLPAGNYTLDVVYTGNQTYESITQELPISIVKRDAKVTPVIKSGEYNHTVIDAIITDEKTGEALVNATAELTLDDGTTIRNTTNDEGIVTFNVLVPTGEHEVNVNLIESPLYNSADANATIEVDKLAVIVTVDELHGVVGENITLVAHVTDLEGNKVSGGNLVFKINGRTLRSDMRFDTNEPAPYKLHVEDGVVIVTLTAYRELDGAEYISASYSGSGIYYENKSEASIAGVVLRNATVQVTTVEVAKQNTEINFTAIITDTTQGSNNKTAVDENAYVIFKLNDKTIKDENNQTVYVKVVNNTATYTYKVPLGAGGLDSETRLIKNYTVTAIFNNTKYNGHALRNTTVFNVERNAIKFYFNRVKVQDNQLSIKADLKDSEGNYVVGTNKICVKINGKTYCENNATKYYYIQNGIVDLSGLDVKEQDVKEVTLVSGDREAYLSTRDLTTEIVKA
jgi:hypothetical protein